MTEWASTLLNASEAEPPMGFSRRFLSAGSFATTVGAALGLGHAGFPPAHAVRAPIDGQPLRLALSGPWGYPQVPAQPPQRAPSWRALQPPAERQLWPCRGQPPRNGRRAPSTPRRCAPS